MNEPSGHRIRRAILPFGVAFGLLVLVRVALLLTGVMPAEAASTVSIVVAGGIALLVSWLGWTFRLSDA